MPYDKQLIAGKLRRWERFLQDYSLPCWDELPTLELYADQVVLLITGYLSFLPKEEEAEKIITPSIIHNYVRMKLMPAPVKKKYGRAHLAYLVMICTLKQSLSISYVKRMVPIGLPEKELQRLYDDFVRKHKQVALYFIELVRSTGRPVLDEGDATEDPVGNLVTEFTIAANMSKLLVEKVIGLQDKRLSDIPPEEMERPPRGN